MTKSKLRSSVVGRAGKNSGQVKESEEIPQLIHRKDGKYEVRIPFKYMLVNHVAARYSIIFDGIIKE